ncbi:MAG: acetyl-CoA carboxylase, carboxyltransferase subunit beta [Dictyoglomus sp.]|nr:acetyl-CoA carboxylase, carboxyltransferase subunit beta [Dictyoglomus sp.]MCX7942541.1 acetyl-CoA carboxylase, carboxyltransferase subunit beta [Dictyoglomaceae bacterium]MDW8188779.1 acetyl-CoA carboxylase, carboxyltransferase subunit beta [Dictyoglomus sp.]
MFMDWLSKKKEDSIDTKKSIFSDIPDGLWVKCPQCNQIIYSKDWLENYKVCIKCGFHSQLTAQERIALLTDEGTFKETDEHIVSFDVLNFHDTKPYTQRLMEAQLETGLKEAVVTGLASIEGISVNLIVMDFRFIGGSMGSVVGEKVTRAIERSINMRIPLISVIASGGARMQEGLISLFQMAKTSSAVARLDKEKILYICILTHPSTAGVLASFGSLGDVIIAEPGALIGFAGPRVIEQTIKQKLPAGFQRSEFVLQHGMIDMVVERKKLKSTIALLLRLLWRKK